MLCHVLLIAVWVVLKCLAAICSCMSCTHACWSPSHLLLCMALSMFCQVQHQCCQSCCPSRKLHQSSAAGHCPVSVTQLQAIPAHLLQVTSQPPLVHGGTLILVASCMLNEWDLQLSEAGPLRQPLKVLKLHGEGLRLDWM